MLSHIKFVGNTKGLSFQPTARRRVLTADTKSMTPATSLTSSKLKGFICKQLCEENEKANDKLVENIPQRTNV